MYINIVSIVAIVSDALTIIILSINSYILETGTYDSLLYLMKAFNASL